MAASLKISELNAVASLADGDLFLITDSSESTSKKLTVANLLGQVPTGAPLHVNVSMIELTPVDQAPGSKVLSKT